VYAISPLTLTFRCAITIAEAPWIEAHTSRMKHRFSAAASSRVRGGTSRLFTAPLTGAFAITTSAHR
jgi:hypothetical protein